MRQLLTQEEYLAIEQKAINLAKFGKKSTHMNELNKFKSHCNNLKLNLPGNVSYMLSELCSEIKSAWGRDREHWLYFVNQTLYKIKSYGVERDLA